ALLPANIMAAAHGAGFLARTPHLLADPVAGALHLVGLDGARTVMRGAGAGVEAPAARLLTAAGHDRSGAIVAFLVPVPGANLVALSGPDRLLGIGLVDHLPGLGHG